jgi:hypothetical protein
MIENILCAVCGVGIGTTIIRLVFFWVDWPMQERLVCPSCSEQMHEEAANLTNKFGGEVTEEDID